MTKRSASWDIGGSLEPLVHVEDKGSVYIVTADLPYVNKEDIEVNLSEDTIEIKAKMRTKHCFERWGTHQKSVIYSSFRKLIKLPSPLNVDKAVCSFRKGLLEINLPKKKTGRRIDIR